MMTVTGDFAFDDTQDYGEVLPKHIARLVKEKTASGRFHALGRDWEFKVNQDGGSPAATMIQYWTFCKTGSIDSVL